MEWRKGSNSKRGGWWEFGSSSLANNHIHYPGLWVLSVPDLRLDGVILGTANQLSPSQAQEKAKEIVCDRLRELLEMWENSIPQRPVEAFEELRKMVGDKIEAFEEEQGDD